jgi:NitT/TauT family transport system substrate-binding protein
MIWAACGGLAFLAIGCGDSQDDPAPPVTLRIGHVGHDHQIALYAAALRPERFVKLGGPWLKQLKRREVYDLMVGDQAIARLILHKVGGGSRMPTALSEGVIDVGFGSVAAAARFREAGHPIKILGPLQTDGDMLAMAPDSGIHTWEQFARRAKSEQRPLVIGYKAPMAIAKLIFTGALDHEGIPYSDRGRPARGVQLRNLMRESSPLVLLEQGQIDGIVWNQPAIAVAESRNVARTVCQLRDLPPAGRWVDHPCCGIVTTEKTIDQHDQALTQLLKLILLATREIQRDPEMAAAVAAEWTGTRKEIEAKSIPTVTYLAEPTDRWIEGMRVWQKLMVRVGGFRGPYAELEPDAFVEDVCHLGPVLRAVAELRKQGLLE